MERQQYLKNMNTKKQCKIKRCSNKIGIENKTCPREIVLGVTSCNHIIKVSIEKCMLTKITKCLLMGNMVRERQLRRCVLCVWRIRDEVFLNIIIYNQSTSYAHMHTQSCSADEWKIKNQAYRHGKKMKSHANTASRYIQYILLCHSHAHAEYTYSHYITG